jgi:hypothetical protein
MKSGERIAGGLVAVNGTHVTLRTPNGNSDVDLADASSVDVVVADRR